MTRPRRRPAIVPLACLLVIVAAGAIAAPAAGPQWPGWRGPARDGVSPDKGLLAEWKDGGPPLAWKATGLGGGLFEPGARRRQDLHRRRP